jgi:hypothetical protein
MARWESDLRLEKEKRERTIVEGGKADSAQ